MGSHVMFCRKHKVKWLSHAKPHTHHLNFFTYSLHCFRPQCSNGYSTFQEHPTVFHDGLTDLHSQEQCANLPCLHILANTCRCDLIHPNWGEDKAHGVFVIYFLAMCRPAFEKCLCKTFARFLICVLAIDFFIYITHLYVHVLETQNGRHTHSVKYFLFSQVLMIYLFIELIKLDIVFYILSF